MTALSYVQRVPDVPALTSDIRLRLGFAPARVDYRSNILTLSFQGELTSEQKASLAAVVAAAEDVATAAAAAAAAAEASSGSDPAAMTFGPRIVSAEQYELVHAWEHRGGELGEVTVQSFVSAGPGDDSASPDFGYDLRLYDATNHRALDEASFSNESWSNCPLAVRGNGAPPPPAFLELHARKRPAGQSVVLSSVKLA
eukprot:jgi/Tetstr1/464109/TSEL_008914.t1